MVNPACHRMIAVVFAVLFGSAAFAAEPFAAERAGAWNRPQQPFRIIGNVYYVGTADLGSYLIVTPQGNILLDGALAESASQIEANVAALGFRLADTKILLASHAHFDHAGGLARLKKDTGARFIASAGDKPIFERGHITYGPSAPVRFTPIRVDQTIRDGETVALGGITLTAHVMPGHTPGCTSWTLPLTENGVRHTAIFYCSTTVAGNPLVGPKAPPGIVADYRATFAKAKNLSADIFLGAHGGFFGLQRKYAARMPNGPNPFIDPPALQNFVANSERDFERELTRQQQALAHPSARAPRH